MFQNFWIQYLIVWIVSQTWTIMSLKLFTAIWIICDGNFVLSKSGGWQCFKFEQYVGCCGCFPGFAQNLFHSCLSVMLAMLHCKEQCDYAYTKLYLFHSKLIQSSDFPSAGVRPEIVNNFSDFFMPVVYDWCTIKTIFRILLSAIVH